MNFQLILNYISFKDVVVQTNLYGHSKLFVGVEEDVEKLKKKLRAGIRGPPVKLISFVNTFLIFQYYYDCVKYIFYI